VSICCCLIIHSIGALAKNGTFGFFALARVVAKTKSRVGGTSFAICAVGCF